MTNKTRGLYNKYRVTKRETGEETGPAIVLKFDDPIARAGIKAWAEEMDKNGYTNVYSDVMKKLGEYNEQRGA